MIYGCRQGRHLIGRRDNAQAVVEMALLLPLLAVLLTGVFEFGMVLYAHVQVSNAVREAARAASLYRSTRFATIDPSKSDTVTCDGSILGWSLDQTIKQAIVYRPLDAQGCPKSVTTYNYTSLGWLDPNPTPSNWQVTLTPAQSSGAMPDAGVITTVTLRYPYRLIVISKFISALSDPVWIQKSVQIEYQN
jgi:Flp pilus assembly protein TadG